MCVYRYKPVQTGKKNKYIISCVLLKNDIINGETNIPAEISVEFWV